MNADRNALIELRSTTNAGMLDCLKALADSGGDVARAVALLKERGIAGVEARAERETTEGRVFIRATATQAAMAQIACETDFAALSAPFLATGANIVGRAFERRSSVPDAEIGDFVADLGRVVKEKVALERLAFVECGEGERLSIYLHADGAIGVLLLWRADSVARTGPPMPADQPATGLADTRVEAFFHDVALHVAAFAPAFLDERSVPAEYLREKAEAIRAEIEADPRASAKPATMREAIAAGKLRKHLALVCLLSQGFVRDEKVPVAGALRRLGDETGFALALLGFDRFEVGQA